VTFATCIHHFPVDVAVKVHPMWVVDSLPAVASAPERCIELCRWLF
jgi:hypothetical protein